MLNISIDILISILIYFIFFLFEKKKKIYYYITTSSYVEKINETEEIYIHKILDNNNFNINISDNSNSSNYGKYNRTFNSSKNYSAL